MAKKVNENLDFGNVARGINLPSPTSAGDIANKAYVDAVPSGLSFIEQPVRVASTVNVNINSPGTNIDSVALNAGDRILLTGQTTAAQNYIYTFNTSTTALTRTTNQYQTGSVVFSTGDGSNNGNIGWILTTDGTITPGTTAATWVAAFRVISAGAGLQISGNVLSLVSPVTVALGGTNATTIAGAIASLGVATPHEYDFGDTVHSSFTFTPTTIAKYPIVQVVNNSTGNVEDVAVTTVPGAQAGNGTYNPTITVTSEAWVASPPGNNAYHVTIDG